MSSTFSAPGRPNYVKLSAVKEGMYHPKIPTFRRMDMDTAAHKLPEEHCRTTTTCGPGDFKNANITLFRSPARSLSCTRITETGRSLREIYPPSNFQLSTSRPVHCSRFSSSMPASELSSTGKGELRFVGYAVRYLRPNVSASWKYTLNQEPNIDQYGQRPIPANIYSRYRDTFPQYSRNLATEAWRT
ncbi:testis, prostate and placenta expressed [Saccoglossus kowalevskii]|uniref:TEPP protein n=1 Tax=Saccoglossus kowalevskii TaxID=10224 RepID=C9QNV0_SACKO|nr:testis, prostate and placenta expressed [Saccoglossus kowalevskii]DAA06550.1 TPA_inf: TEPP protein [Saccoglossus kowalevskii]